jgi:ABC-type dipeptide/oligopeptide/nickel transport system permease component
MLWWTRPLVRLAAALVLPFVVPAVITAVLWALPGNPAEIICPPQICDGTQVLAEKFNLHRGPWAFYTGWMSDALQLRFGNTWRLQQGTPVEGLLFDSLPVTAVLLLLALIAPTVGSVLAATGRMPRRLDPLWQGIGLVPTVILALVAAAWIEITFGALSHDGLPGTLRLVFGALVLAFADGAFAASVVGTRSTFEDEFRQRYVGMAVLRGESPLVNALPNVLPALVGQLRGRVLHLLSGTVVVEVVLGIPGLGELLFDGTLLQDFGVVLAAAWAFSGISAVLLLLQASTEIVVALVVRRAPVVPT